MPTRFRRYDPEQPRLLSLDLHLEHHIVTVD